VIPRPCPPQSHRYHHHDGQRHRPCWPLRAHVHHYYCRGRQAGSPTYRTGRQPPVYAEPLYHRMAYTRSYFCIAADSLQDEENRLAARPSHDIVVSLPAGTNSQYWAVNVIRRDDYFRALLPESRGRVQATPSICPPALKSIGFEECINVARKTGWPAPDGFEHGSING